jgi:hypothetical protein
MNTYTNATDSLKLEFPRTWDPALLTKLTVQVADFDGVDLFVDPIEADLYTPATLSLDSRRYSRTITLTEDEVDEDDPEDVPILFELHAGELIRIVGIQGFEDHVVKGWNPTTLSAELEEAVDRDFEAGAIVYRLSASAAVDFSDTDDFPAGLQMVITWTPTGTGGPLTRLAEIEESLQADLADFTTKFRALYKRAYKALTSPENNLDTVLDSAKDELRTDLLDRGLDISRIKDQRILTPPLMAQVALMWARDGDENTADEMRVYQKAYSAAFEKLCRKPVWQDANGDGVNDGAEVEVHPAQFERNW